MKLDSKLPIDCVMRGLVGTVEMAGAALMSQVSLYHFLGRRSDLGRR